MYEAELTADVTALGDMNERILAAGCVSLGRVCYHDTYYDTPRRTLMGAQRELRLRTCSGDRTYALLTYKDSPVDESSRSKPEHETQVSDPTSARAILCGMGYSPVCRVEKQCALYGISVGGRRLELSLVTVTGVPRTFLEVELPTAALCDVCDALDLIKTVLSALGVPERSITSEYYTDMVNNNAI